MPMPLVTPDELATFLGREVEPIRAASLIADAHALCESLLTPLPTTAAVIVKRVAGRAYLNIESATAVGLGQVSTTLGSQDAKGAPGGMHLTKDDKSALMRLAGRGGAFTIDLLPPDYTPILPGWG